MTTQVWTRFNRPNTPNPLRVSRYLTLLLAVLLAWPMLTSDYSATAVDVEIGTYSATAVDTEIEKGVGPAPPPGSRPRAEIDDLFLEVHRRVESFGGAFVDEETDTLYMYLVDRQPSVVASARAALKNVFGVGVFDAVHVAVLNADYGFQDLKRWHDALSLEVMAVPGVVLTDVDEARNRIVVGVSDPLVLGPAVDAIGQGLQIPAEAILVEFAESVRPGGAGWGQTAATLGVVDMTDPGSPNINPPTLRTRHRPLVGGLQIAFRRDGSNMVCTLGLAAQRNNVGGFITNSHCSVRRAGGADGTVYFQPTRAETNRIGRETVDGAFFVGAPCPTGRQCRRSDANFSPTEALRLRGHIARPPTDGSITWAGGTTYDIINRTTAPVGRTVWKVGRSTGRTKGKVTNTCVNVNVVDTDITYLCQSRAGYASAAGDSGSPVFRVFGDEFGAGGDAKAVGIVGLHWTSGAYFSTIGNIDRAGEVNGIRVCSDGLSC